MKSILFSVTVLFTFVSYSQLNRGNKFIGGSLSISLNDNIIEQERDSTYNDNNSSSFGWSVSPEIGFFIKDGLAFGGGITMGNNSSEFISENNNSKSESTSKYYSIGITSFAKKYFPIKDRFGCFIQGDLSYSYNNSKSETERSLDNFIDASDSESTGNIYSAGISFHLYYFVLEKFTLETSLFGLKYSRISSKTNTQRKRNPEIPIEESSQESVRNSFNFDILNNFTFNRIFSINYYF